MTLVASPLLSDGDSIALTPQPTTPTIIKDLVTGAIIATTNTMGLTSGNSSGRGCSSAGNSFRAKGHAKSASVSTAAQRTQSAVTGAGGGGPKSPSAVTDHHSVNSSTLSALHPTRPRYSIRFDSMYALVRACVCAHCLIDWKLIRFSLI